MHDIVVVDHFSLHFTSRTHICLRHALNVHHLQQARTGSTTQAPYHNNNNHNYYPTSTSWLRLLLLLWWRVRLSRFTDHQQRPEQWRSYGLCHHNSGRRCNRSCPCNRSTATDVSNKKLGTVNSSHRQQMKIWQVQKCPLSLFTIAPRQNSWT